jgi:hypothetical protein
VSLLSVGAVINFGNYDGEPIQWRVLHADDDSVLLLSKYVLSAGAFQSDWEGKNASLYSGSEVRTWLKGTFMTSAFDTTQTAALLTHIGNPAGTDRVFLLSEAELKTYFPKRKSRRVAPAASAAKDQIGFSGEALTTKGAYTSWWLADAANDDFTAKIVKPDGKLGSQLVYYGDVGVRPAIRLDRDKIGFTLDAAGN